MKILMVNKYLYPRAGAETYMLYVSEQLRRAGHEVAFFGMAHPDNTTIGPCTTFPWLEFGGEQRGANLAAAARQTAARTVARRFGRLVDTFRPDLIHAHNVYNQLSPALFRSYMQQVPVVLTVHDFKPVCPSYNLFRDGGTCTLCIEGSALNCMRYRCSHGSLAASSLAALSAAYHGWRKTYAQGYHRYIAPSRFMRDRLVEGGFAADRIDVVNNFAAAPEQRSRVGTGFLFAGRLCAEKGVHTLIEAYAKLKPPRPALTIAGAGPMEGELRNLAAGYGCGEIRWTGRVPPDQVETLLEEAAVSIIPSLWFENCSIAIMESLAHGRPCIVSDSGGNPELLRDRKDGWIFSAGDADALAACLQDAHDADAGRLMQMGVEAADAADRRFSPAVHLDQLLRVYESTRASALNRKGDRR
jgi:glycosyltransferase involved in cell wall biosynthesis